MNEREKTIRLWFDMWLNQQDMGTINHKGQGGLLRMAQAALGKVVAVHGGGDDAYLLQPPLLLQALGNPGTARCDADQLGLGRAQRLQQGAKLLV